MMNGIIQERGAITPHPLISDLYEVSQMTTNILTQERLKQLLHYNQETGIFTRIVTCGGVKAGEIAGCLTHNGYLCMRIDNKRYYLHRLAVLYIRGCFPVEQTDHINHIRNDNRWLNLREVSHRVNGMNASMNARNTSGIAGVCWNVGNNKWQADIYVSGKSIFLGSFKEKSDAIIARWAAEDNHGFHKNHGTKRFKNLQEGGVAFSS